MELHGAITTALPVTPNSACVVSTLPHRALRGICPLIVNGGTLFYEPTANKSNRGQNSHSAVYKYSGDDRKGKAGERYLPTVAVDREKQTRIEENENALTPVTHRHGADTNPSGSNLQVQCQRLEQICLKKAFLRHLWPENGVLLRAVAATLCPLKVQPKLSHATAQWY